MMHFGLDGVEDLFTNDWVMRTWIGLLIEVNDANVVTILKKAMRRI